MKYIKRLLLLSSICLASAIGVSASADYNKLPTSEPAGTVYRLYNPNTGEHFYTAGLYERNSLTAAGWNSEGLGWSSPAAGDPVYRLYNPNAKGGDHYYTKSLFERDSLVKKGWKAEGIGWNSGGDRDVLVSYNPNAASGSHNYTTSLYEQDYLLKNGWKYGSVAWQSVSSPIGTGKLPDAKANAAMSNADLDIVINKMQQLILAKGDYRLGNRVTVFSHGSYVLNGYAHEFKDGIYTKSEYLSFSGSNYLVTDTADPANFLETSNLAEFRSGNGYATALLTAKGWYLLPDYKLQGAGIYKAPDYTKFIQTGNVEDLTNSITDGPIALEPNSQFGAPVLIS
ncbi:hypothetical protein OfM1_15280 [Lactovum odontotermitis]